MTSEFLVVEECLKTFAYDEMRKECILQFAMENCRISDYRAYINTGSGELEVRALENSIVLELSQEHRKIMCEHVPKMLFFHSQKCLSGYVAARKRILSLLRNSAKEKYELLFSLYRRYLSVCPKKQLLITWGYQGKL